MTHSEHINEIAAALANAQGDMRNPTTDSVNAFQKYRYAKAGDFLNIIRPALSKHGIAFNQDVTEHTDGRKEIMFMLSHGSGQWMKFTMPLNPTLEANKGSSFDQAWGGHLTYRKKSLMSLVFGIHGDEDDDGASGSTTIADRSPQQPLQQKRVIQKKEYERVTSDQIKQIMFEIGEHEDIVHKLFETYNISSFNDLPKEHYINIIKKIRATVDSRK